MSAVIQFDIWAAIKLQKHQLPIVNKILLAITRSANGGLIWILAGLGVLAGFREKHFGILFFCVLIFTAVINNLILKSIFMRKRPCDLFQRIPVQIKRPCGSSFPSGHTAVSFACATALCAIYLPIGIAAICLAAVIGFTRVYFFVHFPTDVLFGMISGVTIAGGCIFLLPILTGYFL